VYALGQPAGDTSIPGQGTESDLLHFTAEDEQGNERIYLPVFTRPELMREALLRNVEWQSMSVLQVNGGALLDNVDNDVCIVINPWTSNTSLIPERQPIAIPRTDLGPARERVLAMT